MPRPKILLTAAMLASLAASASALADTRTFPATADAHVQSDLPNTNFGSDTRLATKGWSPGINTLLRFSVANVSGTVTSAKLRLYVNNPTTDGPALYRATTTAWTETGVTWNNRPAATGTAFGNIGNMPTATWIEFEVKSYVTGNGTYNFVLAGGIADGGTFHARTSTSTAYRPQLVVTTTTTTTTTPTEPTPTPEPTPEPTPTPTTGTSLDVVLQPASGISGTQRVNFAVPLAKGQLLDPDRVRVLASGIELRAARRELASHPDGSVRSVQLQVDTGVTAGKILQVRINETPTTTPLALVAVSTTLVAADGSQGPRVWARLPATWLAASGVTGPQVTEAAVNGTALDAWDNVCDYQNHTISSFLSAQSSKDSWLYDRGTAMYRGYARRGDQLTLESAYRETAIYRNGMTGTDSATRIGVPGAADDLKYHYNQNLAIHYLLTGDDRFRESAEDLATRVASLWSSPGYAGGSDFWTERHAGFGLLAYVWARIVTDDQGAYFEQLADTAVNAYISMQNASTPGWTDTAARCFGHQASAHGESYGTWGCSPWMSAILADALDAYATDRPGTEATNARTAIVKLGRMIAKQGRDSVGKPYYWLGLGTAADETDPYNEHWGESAYVVAMAWHWGGRTDATLRTAADQLVAGTRSHGTSPYLRSFNWQCRSAVATPWYLR